jgi:hypothetical protein
VEPGNREEKTAGASESEDQICQKEMTTRV